VCINNKRDTIDTNTKQTQRCRTEQQDTVNAYTSLAATSEVT